LAYVRSDGRTNHVFIGSQEIAQSPHITTVFNAGVPPSLGFETDNIARFIGRDGLVYDGEKDQLTFRNCLSGESAALSLAELKAGGWWTFSVNPLNKIYLHYKGVSYPYPPNQVENPVLLFRAGQAPIVVPESGAVAIYDLKGNLLFQIAGAEKGWRLASVSRSGSHMIWENGKSFYYVNASRLKFQRINNPESNTSWGPVSWDAKENLLLIQISTSKQARLLTISEENP
jgi:hypothetical protein